MAMIQAGRHDVKVKSTALSTTKTGKDQVVIEFADDIGDTIKAFLVMTDDSWEYIEPKLSAIGWDGASRDWPFEEFNETPCLLEGNPCNIVVKDREYPEGSGKFTPQVAYINPIGGMVRNRMNAEEAMSAAERLRKMVRGKAGQVMKPKASRPKAVPKAEEVAPWEGDEGKTPF